MAASISWMAILLLEWFESRRSSGSYRLGISNSQASRKKKLIYDVKKAVQPSNLKILLK